jgi:hypothetical protein
VSVLSAPKIEQISQAADKKTAIIKAVGDLSGVRVCSDLVLMGTYIQGDRTAGGVYRPTTVLQESEFQGKVGLVLKAGPLAFGDWEDDDERGQNAKPHTWVIYQIKDAWPMQFNQTACRMIPYNKIRMVISDPELVF